MKKTIYEIILRAKYNDLSLDNATELIVGLINRPQPLTEAEEFERIKAEAKSFKPHNQPYDTGLC